MDIGLTEVVAFVYTLGVLVTGMWVVGVGLPPLTPWNVGLVVFLTLAWTVYFSWTIAPRIVDLETEDEADEEEKDPAEPDV